MRQLPLILASTAAAGVLSSLLAGLFLLAPERLRTRAIGPMVSFAIGSLLGAALLGLLPAAFAAAPAGHHAGVGAAAVAGILVFFLIEKWVLWRHCHHEECEHHPVQRSSAGTLVLVGDSLHNFVDGLLLSAAFLTDLHVGLASTLAVAAHEIPQELGDLAILVHSGFGRARALAANALSGAAMVAGGVVGWAALSVLTPAVPYLLGFAAASFLYIAAADLIPEQHRRLGLRATAEQLTLIAAGAATVWLVQASLAHHH